jgi:hypothetical protein
MRIAYSITELDLCKKYYSTKQFEKAYLCFNYMFLNADKPEHAAVYLTYMNYSLFFAGDYDKVEEGTINYLGTYETDYKYLFVINIFLNALSHYYRVPGCDRNVYPDGRQAFINLELLFKNKDTPYEINKKLKDAVIYYFLSLVDIFVKNEEYVMKFYKRTGEKKASELRKESYNKFKAYYDSLIQGLEGKLDNETDNETYTDNITITSSNY